MNFVMHSPNNPYAEVDADVKDPLVVEANGRLSHLGIRHWYLSDQGDHRRTKKGVSFKIADLPFVIEALITVYNQVVPVDMMLEVNVVGPDES